MARLEFDTTGERYFETGVRNCVFYKFNATAATTGYGEGVTTNYGPGVAWNGVSSISESADGGDSNPIYADDIKYLDLRSLEDTSLSLEAYTYPEAFADCDGTKELVTGVRVGQQRRKPFGLSYVTRVGNDVDFEEYGDKYHLVYGCMAAPAERSYETINDSPEAITFSWDISTTPIPLGDNIDGKPTAILTVDTSKGKDLQDAAKTAFDSGITKLQDALYGTANTSAYLPTPEQVAGFFS